MYDIAGLIGMFKIENPVTNFFTILGIVPIGAAGAKKMFAHYALIIGVYFNLSVIAKSYQPGKTSGTTLTGLFLLAFLKIQLARS